jgi:hypothetical protein
VSGITGVSVTLAGTASGATTTDTSGNFSFATLAAGTYTVSPSKTGYVFSPVSRDATLTSVSLTDLTFTATASTAATYSISGTVSGSAVAGVVITLNGSNVGSAVTDLSGNYTFSGLVSGTYTLTAALDGFTFTSPLIVSLSNLDSASNNFTSTAASAGGSLAFTAVATLPQATVGSPYSSSVIESISGGTAPYHYEAGTLAAGTPPLGMILNPSGNLTGTPSVPGIYDFTVCATDSAGATSACEATSITVVAAGTTSPPPPTPTVVLTANPSTITAGKSSVLTWSSQNATSCEASGGWTGSKADNGSFSVDPTTTTTFVITCAGTGGSDNASALVTVQTAPAAVPTVTLTASSAKISSGSSSTLTWSSTNASSCTASGGWSGSESVSGTRSVSPTSTTTYTLSCKGAGGVGQTSATVTVGTSTTPPPAGTSWVYYNGAFDWPGDYSYDAVPNYADTSGGPLSGAHDIKVTLTSAYGGWLPYAQNWDFNSAGYTKLTFALKPTVANQKWWVYFVKVGDVPVGIYLDVANYGPAPVVGQWNTYTVPLSDLGVLGTSIYKFCIQDQTGLSNNAWYADNVGFTP